MAGVMKSGRHAQGWPDGDEKSDHFVGLCYADYVAAGGLLSAAATTSSRRTRSRASCTLQNDAADELLKRVLQRRRARRSSSGTRRARGSSPGQRKTLARLGIAFDRVFFESDFLPRRSRADRERACASGTAQPPRGRRGRSTRPASRTSRRCRWCAPTACRRSTCARSPTGCRRRNSSTMTSLQVCGAEWVSHAAGIRKLDAS